MQRQVRGNVPECNETVITLESYDLALLTKQHKIWETY
jgi:hypothetical protein